MKERLPHNVYYQLRDYTIPLLVVAVCILLFSFFIVPQAQELFVLAGEEQTLRKRVSVLRANAIMLTQLSDERIDENFKLAVKALPAEKDFGAIIEALSLAASSANVALSDYEFSVGDLSTGSATVVGKPSLTIILNLTSDIEGTKRFLEKLAQTIPLSEVVSVEASARSATLTTQFYYKPYVQQQRKEFLLVEGFSKKDEELLKTLSSFLFSP